MNKKSIICIVIAVILVIVGFAAKNTSKQTEVISKAVYVEDGKVLPENEGKIVIVPGEVKAVAPLVDKLTGIELPGIKAKRVVERYQRGTKTENEKTYDVLEWKSTILGKENEFNEFVSSSLIADCKVGDFSVDNAVLSSVSSSKRYHDFDRNAVHKEGYYITTHDDITYLTKTDYMPYGGEELLSSFKRNGITTVYYRDFENTPRINYTVENEDSHNYTFVGRQKDGKLMYDKDLGMQVAFSGLMTPDQLAKKVKSGGMIGAIVAWVLAAFLLFLGIYLGKKRYVPTDEELEEIEKEIN